MQWNVGDRIKVTGPSWRGLPSWRDLPTGKCAIITEIYKGAVFLNADTPENWCFHISNMDSTFTKCSFKEYVRTVYRTE